MNYEVTEKKESSPRRAARGRREPVRGHARRPHRPRRRRRRAAATIYSIIEDGQQFEAMVDEQGAHEVRRARAGQLFHLEAHRRALASCSPATEAVATGPQNVTAEMPGKVVKIEAAVGDAVADRPGRRDRRGDEDGERDQVPDRRRRHRDRRRRRADRRERRAPLRRRRRPSRQRASSPRVGSCSTPTSAPTWTTRWLSGCCSRRRSSSSSPSRSWRDPRLRAAAAARLLGVAGRSEVRGLRRRGGAVLRAGALRLVRASRTGPARRPGRAARPRAGARGHRARSRARCRSLELVAIGPLTNLARALALDPELPERVAGLTVMGGHVREARIGDLLCRPGIDYNLCSDPEATVTVLGAGFRTRSSAPTSRSRPGSTRADLARLDAAPARSRARSRTACGCGRPGRCASSRDWGAASSPRQRRLPARPADGAGAGRSARCTSSAFASSRRSSAARSARSRCRLARPRRRDGGRHGGRRQGGGGGRSSSVCSGSRSAPVGPPSPPGVRRPRPPATRTRRLSSRAASSRRRPPRPDRVAVRTGTRGDAHQVEHAERAGEEALRHDVGRRRQRRRRRRTRRARRTWCRAAASRGSTMPVERQEVDHDRQLEARAEREEQLHVHREDLVHGPGGLHVVAAEAGEELVDHREHEGLPEQRAAEEEQASRPARRAASCASRSGWRPGETKRHACQKRTGSDNRKPASSAHLMCVKRISVGAMAWSGAPSLPSAAVAGRSR